MPGAMQNRRNAPRAAFIAVIEVTEVATGTRLSARTSDLSLTGCYVDTLNPTPVNAIVQVHLTHAGEELELPARVVYVSPRLGMGVRFDDDLPPAKLAVLDRWIAEAK
jgi:hypothetical protein